MDNAKPPPKNNHRAIVALAQVLDPEQMQLLARLMVEVIDDTGYGDVKIIIAEKRVVRLKAEKSY